MKKIIFIDRDGTIIEEPPITKQVNSLEEMIFLPGVINSLSLLSNNGFRLVLVTNQDGLGTINNPLENYRKINKKLFEILGGEAIFFDEIFECPHYEDDKCKCRKPLLGILGDYLEKNNIDYSNSYIIGDRESDMEFANNIGVRGYKVGDLELNWKDISNKIIGNN